MADETMSSPVTTTTANVSPALGVLLIILGFIAILIPVYAALAVNFFVGWILFFGGLVQIGMAISLRKSMTGKEKAFGWIGGLLFAIFGLLLVFNPLVGVVTLSILFGAFLVIWGIIAMVMAFAIRPQPKWGWSLLGGLVSLIFGIIVFALDPFQTAWLMGFFVGLVMLMIGFSAVLGNK